VHIFDDDIALYRTNFNAALSNYDTLIRTGSANSRRVSLRSPGPSSSSAVRRSGSRAHALERVQSMQRRHRSPSPDAVTMTTVSPDPYCLEERGGRQSVDIRRETGNWVSIPPVGRAREREGERERERGDRRRRCVWCIPRLLVLLPVYDSLKTTFRTRNSFRVLVRVSRRDPF